MKTTRLLRLCLASVCLVVVGCGNGTTTDPSAQSGSCKGEGDACDCTKSLHGALECRSGKAVCVCEDGHAPGSRDAGESHDAGKSTNGNPATASNSADSGAAKPDAGQPATVTTGPASGTPFSGPLDGDPAKPMVSIPGVPCGAPAGGFGAAPPSVKITNRDVVVAYPCAHEGAAVTFFLFLHGTLQEEQKVAFTMNAFSIHKLVDSHNVIVVLPKAIGTQWGNGDNGADAPHLSEVVDWVYATFGDKFNIRSMWAQGGSWGAAYLAGTFACDAKYQDKLRGIQLVVGGGCPRCSNRLSCIVAQQELQLGNGMALSDAAREMAVDSAGIAPYAMQHGCMGKTAPMTVGASKYWPYPGCQQGWVHSYYLGPGQHADAWDAPTVLKMTEEMKSTE